MSNCLRGLNKIKFQGNFENFPNKISRNFPETRKIEVNNAK